MNLEELKTAWVAYDRQVQMSQRIHDKVITSMIATRSSSRFSTVRRNYVFGIAWIAICLMVGIIVMTTNPFDYRYSLQYAPIGIYCFCLLIILGGMTGGYLRLNRVSIERDTLESSLKKIIGEYERPQKLMKYALIVLLFTAVVLFPLSFLPTTFERLIPMGISALLLLIAYKMGAFDERDKKGFKDDFTELEQLKAMQKELQASN